MRAELDAAAASVARDLATRGAPAPDVLFFTALGAGMLAERFTRAARFPLARADGIPDAWRASSIIAGEIGGGVAWLVEDAPGAPEDGGAIDARAPAWTRGFPCWLAAIAGARTCAYASAGVALPVEREPLAPGVVALVRDHVNLSGTTPLLGLGASKLGPLFPDQSRTHDARVRSLALARARQLGVAAREAVAICTTGPAIETAAERRFWARAGGDVAVQDLADVVIACSHAGLATLCLIGVTDAGSGHEDLRELLASAEKLAPAVEELLAACAPDLVDVARVEREAR